MLWQLRHLSQICLGSFYGVHESRRPCDVRAKDGDQGRQKKNWKKNSSAVRETGVSRHNEGGINKNEEPFSLNPQYGSDVMNWGVSGGPLIVQRLCQYRAVSRQLYVWLMFFFFFLHQHQTTANTNQLLIQLFLNQNYIHPPQDIRFFIITIATNTKWKFRSINMNSAIRTYQRGYFCFRFLQVNNPKCGILPDIIITYLIHIIT